MSYSPDSTAVARPFRLPWIITFLLLVLFAGPARAAEPAPGPAPAAPATARRAQLAPLESASAKAREILRERVAKNDPALTRADPALAKAATDYKARLEAKEKMGKARDAAAAARSAQAKLEKDLAAAAGDRAGATRIRADLDKARAAVTASVQAETAELATDAASAKSCDESVKAYFLSKLHACDLECTAASKSLCGVESKAAHLDVEVTARFGATDLLGGATSSAVGGVAWQGAVVNGLADFLSQRADKELVLWLSTQIVDKLCSAPDKRATAGAPAVLAPSDLFPSTCKIVGTKKDAATPESGSLLAAAIRRDLETLPARVAASALKIDLAVVEALQTTLVKMSVGVAPLEVLAGLSRDKLLERKCKDDTGATQALACALRLTGLATKLSADAASGSYSDEDVQAFLLTIHDACGPACAQAVINEETVADFYGAVRRFAEAVKAQRGQSGSTAERAAVMIAATLDLFESAIAFYPDGSPVHKTWADIEPALRSMTYFLRGEYADGLQALAASIRALSGASDKQAWKDFIRLSSLVADIASAKDSKQVQSALEAAAAPVGTWREKRRSPMLSATGLVGISIGAEIPTDGAGNKRSPYAAGAPLGMVGLDLSFPVGDSAWTAGLFVSALDVGQLVTLPFSSPSRRTPAGTDEAPAVNKDVTLSQVLSPGAYLKLGIGNYPLVLGAGFSYAPDLRSYASYDITTGKEITRDVLSMWRVHAFLAVDVTILPILRFGD